ncbi:MAG: hypothetical protein J0I06_26105 [Planctomycetes bacterium]|nr:hypothetical protein [Planctomycetota bacterium]
MLRVLLLGIAAVGAGALVGCGSNQTPPPPDPKQAALEEVYALYKLRAEQGKPPARRVEELYPFENAYPIGYAAVKSGEVVVNWTAPPSSNSSAVLAYQKEAPSAGGWVAFQDGTVKHLTAEEFAAAPKAK